MSVVDTAKTAYDLAKKGMTVEFQEKIMQLREEALELQEENVRLRKENRGLKERVELRETVHFRRSVYWQDGDAVPFCPYCYQKSHLLIHLSGPQWDGPERSVIWDCQECAISYHEVPAGNFDVWRSRMTR